MNTSFSTMWGQDIALDDTGQALVAASGEFILTEGVETGLQDIRLRLFTRLGSLFYDQGWGSLIHDWIFEENTEGARIAFEAEVTLRVELDPRVQVGSVRTTVFTWDERTVQAEVSWTFIGEDQPSNLILRADKSVRELVVQDVDPASV